MVKNYLPSAKFIGVLLFVCAGVSTLFLGKSIQDTDRRTELKALAGVSQGQIIVLGEIVQKDTDADGVADWEEGLWGTDPKKSVSNPSGIPDKEYVDGKKAQFQKDNGIVATSDESLSETEQFAREFFTTILALQQSGNLTSSNLAGITNSFFSHIKNYPRDPEYYSENNLKIITNPSTQDTFRYLDSMAAILKKPVRNDDSIVVVALAARENSTVRLKELTPIAAAYTAIETAIAKLSVPASATTVHLNLLNSYHDIARDIHAMEKVTTDPLPSIIAVLSYERHIDDLLGNLSAVSSYAESLNLR